MLDICRRTELNYTQWANESEKIRFLLDGNKIIPHIYKLATYTPALG